MHPLNGLVLLAGLASATYVPGDLESRAACPEVQIIALGGEGTTVGDLGYLDTTIAAIQSAVPSAELFQIGYPAGSDSPTAISYGVPQLREHLHNYIKQCPKTKLVTVGYSAGGAAVMDVLCGAVDTGDEALPKFYRHHIIANIIYGDPTYLPGLRYSVGTCQHPGEVPRVRPGECFPFGRKTKSYCSANDQICCDGNGDESIHFSYPAQYDADAAHWVKAKYNYWKNNF